MVDSIRASLGRNAGIKFAFLLVIAALLPCYCVAAGLLAVNQTKPALVTRTAETTAIAGLPDASVQPSLRPSITPFGRDQTLVPTATLALQSTPVQLATPLPYVTYDSNALFGTPNNGVVDPNANGAGEILIGTPSDGSLGTGVSLLACPGDDGQGSNTIQTSVGVNALIGGTIYCKTIKDPYKIGVQAVLDRGVKVAIEIFALRDGGASITRFSQPIRICLQGEGAYIFLDANDSPRQPRELPAELNGTYICGTINSAGLVVLTER
jgi:hypothetical protein